VIPLATIKEHDGFVDQQDVFIRLNKCISRRLRSFVHVSQLGLSQQIKALEEELGVLLLDRTKRSVTLTEAGKYFLEEAKRSLEHAERAKAVARKVSRGELGTVRIGHVPSIPFGGLLTKLTSAFHRYAPDIHLEFVEGDPVDLLAGIMECSRPGLARFTPHARTTGAWLCKVVSSQTSEQGTRSCSARTVQCASWSEGTRPTRTSSPM
jgi:hypothetical protein